VERIDEIRNINNELYRKNDYSSSVIESLTDNVKELKHSNAEFESQISMVKRETKKLRSSVETLESENKNLVERNLKLARK
jgi:predicted nuclease with TOPRIM domain